MTTYRRIEAVNKAGEIIKYLANQKTATTGPDVARAVNLPTGTTMCHLVTLADLGFVRQVGDGWELGIGLSLLWARYKSQVEGKIDRLQSELKSLEA